MPGLDGTGPNGIGPMTGGGFGRCNPQGISRQGCGRGRGRRSVVNLRSNAEVEPSNNTSEISDEKLTSLKQHNEELENQIIQARQETTELTSKIEELSAIITKMQSKPQKRKAKES